MLPSYVVFVRSPMQTFVRSMSGCLFHTARRLQHVRCTPTHEYVRSTSAPGDAPEMLVQLGLTDFGVDQIGNIQALKLKAKLGEPLAKGEPICDLDWEGLRANFRQLTFALHVCLNASSMKGRR